MASYRVLSEPGRAESGTRSNDPDVECQVVVSREVRGGGGAALVVWQRSRAGTVSVELSPVTGHQTSGTATGTTRPTAAAPCGAVASWAHASKPQARTSDGR
jgi:hypothetical protein